MNLFRILFVLYNIIKGVRNLLRLKKEIDDTLIKDIRNIFTIKKANEVIKDRVIRYLRNLSEYEEEVNYYKPEKVGNFWCNNYIEYESNGDSNKALSIEVYLNEVRPYLKDIINDLEKSDTWKFQLTAIKFISSKDNVKEHVIHSKSNNIEFIIDDNVDEVPEELLNHLIDIKLDGKH